jgi:hypothetical protein
MVFLSSLFLIQMKSFFTLHMSPLHFPKRAIDLISFIMFILFIMVFHPSRFIIPIQEPEI